MSTHTRNYRDRDYNRDFRNKNAFYSSSASNGISANYGKYGLLNLSDVFTRKVEFQAWLTEVKNKSLSDLNSENERKYLEEFIDKYNNAEFPSKKYYDIIKYQARKIEKALRRKKKEKDHQIARGSVYAIEETEFIFDDEWQKEKEKKILKELEQKKKLEDAINTMDKKKAEAMKEIDFKGNLMRHLYQTGDITAAKDIHKQYFDTKNEKEGRVILAPISDMDAEDNN